MTLVSLFTRIDILFPFVSPREGGDLGRLGATTPEAPACAGTHGLLTPSSAQSPCTPPAVPLPHRRWSGSWPWPRRLARFRSLLPPRLRRSPSEIGRWSWRERVGQSG